MLSTAMATAFIERFFGFFIDAFFTPPIDIGAGPREFIADPGARLPPTLALFTRRFGAVLLVSLIIASSDWSSMAAMVCGARVAGVRFGVARAWK